MQSPNPYSQQPQANPYAQAHPYAQQQQVNPYAQANPYAQQQQATPPARQPQANPSVQQSQPETKNYLTRTGTGKHFWFVSRPDSNGNNFAILCYSIMYVPVAFFGRYYVKFEGKASSTSATGQTYLQNGSYTNYQNTTVTRVTTLYRTPLNTTEILLLYAFIFSSFIIIFGPILLMLAAFILLYLDLMPLWLLEPMNSLLDNPMFWGFGSLIWILVSGVVIPTLYESYTGTGKRPSKEK
jgi:hypothetical protein